MREMNLVILDLICDKGYAKVRGLEQKRMPGIVHR